MRHGGIGALGAAPEREGPAGRETETETQRMRRLRESTRHERKGERQGVTNRGRERRERDGEK